MFGGRRVRSRSQRRNRSRSVRRSRSRLGSRSRSRSRSRSGSRNRNRRTRRRQSRGGSADGGIFGFETHRSSDAYGGKEGAPVKHKIIGDALIVRQRATKEKKMLIEIDHIELSSAQYVRKYAEENSLDFQLIYNNKKYDVTNLYETQEDAEKAKAEYGMKPAPHALNTKPTERGGVLPPVEEKRRNEISHILEQWFPYAVEIKVE